MKTIHTLTRQAATLAAALLTVLLAASCGTDSRHFKIDGRLLHINQGEFYVYSPDGTLAKGIDTIKVQAGRFAYELQCDHPMTLMIVFPNFTEQPVFAQPGKSVDMRGDASHLKELTVKGTKDNELMNKFRERIASASPPEAIAAARQTVEDNPASMVGAYLVNKYFVQTDRPDFKTASHLVDIMMAAQPDNGYLKRMKTRLAAATVAAKGTPLPQINATTLDGKPMGRAQLTAAPVTVVCAWATWRYESTDLFKRLCMYAATTSGRVAVVGVSVDADPALVKQTMTLQNLSCPVVCDGRMVESPLFAKLGMYNIPDNIVIRGGRIAAAHLADNALMEEIKK